MDSRNVHAFIVGEHGDSELAAWSCANIYGISMEEFAKLRGFSTFHKEMDEIYHAVRDSAYEIIERKGATYYGIGMAAARIAEAIVRRQPYCNAGICFPERRIRACPAVPEYTGDVGKGGAEQILEISFSDEEMEKLAKSANELKSFSKM